MKFSVEDVNSVKKVLHVQVAADEVMKELNSSYDTLRQNVKVKGFRPGKAPQSVLEGMYKKKVDNEVISKLIDNSSKEAIKESCIKNMLNITIDPTEIKKNDPYNYSITIEIRPEIENIDFKGIDLKKRLYKVSDEEVDMQLKAIHKKVEKTEPIKEDRSVREGDFVVIDYEGFLDGEPFSETGKQEKSLIRIGDGTISKNFDDDITGMNPGENKDITVKFPENYPNNKLSNLTIRFDVKLREIRQEAQFEMNDEFVKQLGEYETVEELKNTIRKNLSIGYEKRSEQELNEQVFLALIDRTKFDLPDYMVNYELEHIVKDIETRFADNNISMEESGLTKEGLMEQYRSTAENQVKRQLLLEKIFKQEKLELSDEELEKEFKKISEIYDQPLDQIKEGFNKNKVQLESFKKALLEKKAMKLIIEHNNVEEVEMVPEPEAS